VTSLKAVSFDCALTLVDVRWSPGRSAAEAAASLGLSTDQQTAAEVFERLFFGRGREYAQSSASDAAYRDFWVQLGQDWSESMEWGRDRGEELMMRMDEQIYRPESGTFVLYDDVLPCLNALAKTELRLAVISNWDRSLYRVLEAAGIADHFEVITASMVVGSEKPDGKIFTTTLKSLGVNPGEVLHVGDNPMDDVEGGRRIGMKTALIDREMGASFGAKLASLTDLPELISSI
jgi:putative hydrolase of the HAD superfamily